jgi:hypothetical protein
MCVTKFCAFISILQLLLCALELYASSQVEIQSFGRHAENFSALTRLDHNRAVAQVGIKANVPIEQVNPKGISLLSNYSFCFCVCIVCTSTTAMRMQVDHT